MLKIPRENSRAAGKASAERFTFLKTRYEWSSFFWRICSAKNDS